MNDLPHISKGALKTKVRLINYNIFKFQQPGHIKPLGLKTCREQPAGQHDQVCLWGL